MAKTALNDQIRQNCVFLFFIINSFTTKGNELQPLYETCDDKNKEYTDRMVQSYSSPSDTEMEAPCVLCPPNPVQTPSFCNAQACPAIYLYRTLKQQVQIQSEIPVNCFFASMCP